MDARGPVAWSKRQAGGIRLAFAIIEAAKGCGIETIAAASGRGVSLAGGLPREECRSPVTVSRGLDSIQWVYAPTQNRVVCRLRKLGNGKVAVKVQRKYWLCFRVFLPRSAGVGLAGASLLAGTSASPVRGRGSGRRTISVAHSPALAAEERRSRQTRYGAAKRARRSFGIVRGLAGDHEAARRFATVLKASSNRG